MKHHNSVFQQLLKTIPRHQFQKVVDRHNVDHRVRTLSCWTQLVAMIFAQLASRVSIRDLVENFNTCYNHHYHLSVSRIKRSSLSDANSTRAVGIFFRNLFLSIAKGQEPSASGSSQ